MKKFSFCLTLGIFLLGQMTFAQVQVDKQMQLTGTGSDASISGIKSVLNSQDATSVESLQKGSFTFAAATGSNNDFAINISPPISSYQTGMTFNFLSNQTVTGPVTLDVNGLGPVAITKNFNLPFSGCEIQSGQVVTVVFDGTNFQMTSSAASGSAPTISNAGTDQLNVVGTTASLAGNTPLSGTGVWTIVSGSGGNVTNPSSPTSNFTGVGGNSYVLQWTISNSCGTSSSQVSISFSLYSPGSQSFLTPGGPYNFSVPLGVSSLTLECWGAQGANTGGLGGYAKGVLSVTPGAQLSVFVGGQNGTNGGGAGGNGANGGGMSDVRQGGIAVSDMVLVAGGGGGRGEYSGGAGGGGDACANGAGGGPGIAYIYNSTSYSGPGYNGTCSSGGAGGNGYGGFAGGGGGGGLAGGGSGGSSGGYGSYGQNGSQGQGGGYGSNGSCGGTSVGGGGGGFYGGGGGANGQCSSGGGGGGSSWAAPGLTQLSFTGGVQSGDGKVIVTW